MKRELFQFSAFQFQYGAIRGNNPHLVYANSYLFQFQYGAIRGKRLTGKVLIVRHFNSSMVRLEASKKVHLRSLLSISIPVWCD